MSAHETLAALALQRELEAKVERMEADPRTSGHMLKTARMMADYVAGRNRRLGLSEAREDPQN
jgi:hypothetical protein